jgi:hypothetical protein
MIDREDVVKKEKIKDFERVDSSCLFKTYKTILSNGKFYSSKAHYLLDIPKDSFFSDGENVIDTPKFYEDLDYFYIFSK